MKAYTVSAILFMSKGTLAILCTYVHLQQGGASVIEVRDCTYVYMSPDLRKPGIMMHFGNPDFCFNEFHVSKALFCSNISAVLLIFMSYKVR